MVDLDELERRWHASPVRDDGAVHLLVVRGGDERHVTRDHIELTPEGGITGDRWASSPPSDPEAAVSLIERRVVDLLTGGDPERWHVPGDNLVVDLDLSIAALPVGTRLHAGTALLEITAKPHLGCKKFRARLGDDAFAWVNDATRRDRRLRGIVARVVAAGVLARGARLVRPAATALPETSGAAAGQTG